ACFINPHHLMLHRLSALRMNLIQDQSQPLTHSIPEKRFLSSVSTVNLGHKKGICHADPFSKSV
ncbi:hypothetical protein, partial [Shewanella baltica]|uniref:hypothetical protein n=1 Tax=Shewanella baltica TaxID=62322 RepID=UPI0039AED5C5